MRGLTLLFAVTTALEAQDGKPVLKYVDGAYERLQQGGADATPGLEVSSQVRVLLKVDSHSGDSRRGRITYRLIQRFPRAQSEIMAERASEGGATISSVPGVTSISAEGRGAFTTLEVYVPPEVKTATVEIVRSGDIEVYGFRGNLLAHTLAGDIVADGIGGDLQAYTGGGHIQLGQVGGKLNCSTGAGSITVESVAGEINCQTLGGEIVVKQARGPVTLSSAGGNIAVDQASQGVDAHSLRGEIVVKHAGGLVTASTGGGAIRIGSAAGVRATSASGPIYLMGASGALSVSTAVGSILADLLAGARLQNSSLMAGSGDITVRIPSGVALSVKATNERGGAPHIESDFSGMKAALFEFGRPPLVEGNINGGGPTLVLSGSDMIYLQRSR